MTDIIKQANSVIDKRMANYIKDSEGDKEIGHGLTCHKETGHYQGFGFRSESICPNKSCHYYKYVGWNFSPVCTHSNVIWAVEIGGVYKCPKNSLETLFSNCMRFLKYARNIACPVCLGKRRG